MALDVPHRGQASFIHITEMVANLRTLGWHIDLFAPSPMDHAQPPLLSRALEHVRVIFHTLLRLRSYEVIYIRAHFLAWPVTFAARCFGIVILQEVNGSYLDVLVSHPWLKPVAAFIAWLYRWQYRHSDRILPVTKELGVWLQNEGVECPLTIIPNAANTDIFRPLAGAAERPMVVFFGGLTKWHGVDLMVNAVHHPAWPKGVELVVIGAGSEQDALIAAQAAGAPVRWLGYRPNHEIPELIAGALAGLVPITDPSGRSATGALPLKLFEILACGLPAIVTEVPGQADLVREGHCGLVIAPEPHALALAVAHLNAHPHDARAMGERGSSLVASAHSWAARAAEVSAIIARHLHDRQSRDDQKNDT
jgi:glycosyltransferase involved in cell wall biosynthesis